MLAETRRGTERSTPLPDAKYESNYCKSGLKTPSQSVSSSSRQPMTSPRQPSNLLTPKISLGSSYSQLSDPTPIISNRNDLYEIRTFNSMSQHASGSSSHTKIKNSRSFFSNHPTLSKAAIVVLVFSMFIIPFLYTKSK